MRVFKVLIGTLALLAATMVPVAANADANIQLVSNCPPGNLCLYVDNNVNGNGVRFTAAHSNFALIECPPSFGCNGVPGRPPTFDNDASAWHNNTGRVFCVSDGHNGGNPDNTMPPGSSGSFGTTGWDNRASSLSTSGCP